MYQFCANGVFKKLWQRYYIRNFGSKIGGNLISYQFCANGVLKKLLLHKYIKKAWHFLKVPKTSCRLDVSGTLKIYIGVFGVLLRHGINQINQSIQSWNGRKYFSVVILFCLYIKIQFVQISWEHFWCIKFQIFEDLSNYKIIAKISISNFVFSQSWNVKNLENLIDEVQNCKGWQNNNPKTKGNIK